MPGFGLVYTASKAMSSYVGRAINWEVKNSEYADLIDTQVLFPGGTFTNLFKRPESSKFARMNAMQKPFLQHTPAAVSAFLNSLKGGYAFTWGSFFCESFTRATWFGIWGNLPSFKTVHKILGSYYTPALFSGIPEDEDKDDKIGVLYHFWLASKQYFSRPTQ